MLSHDDSAAVSAELDTLVGYQAFLVSGNL